MAQLKQYFPIDVAMVQIITKEQTPKTLSWKTAIEVGVEAIINEGEAVPLVIKGVKYAGKKAKNVLVGHTLTTTENSFTPDVYAVVNGGTVTVDESGDFVSYSPPATGEIEEKIKFDFIVYENLQDSSDNTIGYLKTTYYNCEGSAINATRTDNTFFAPEFIITSTPATGQKPFFTEKVDALPVA